MKNNTIKELLKKYGIRECPICGICLNPNQQYCRVCKNIAPKQFTINSLDIIDHQIRERAKYKNTEDRRKATIEAKKREKEKAENKRIKDKANAMRWGMLRARKEI